MMKDRALAHEKAIEIHEWLVNTVYPTLPREIQEHAHYTPANDDAYLQLIERNILEYTNLPVSRCFDACIISFDQLRRCVAEVDQVGQARAIIIANGIGNALGDMVSPTELILGDSERLTKVMNDAVHSLNNNRTYRKMKKFIISGATEKSEHVMPIKESLQALRLWWMQGTDR